MGTAKPYLTTLDYSPDGVQATLQWVAYLGDTFGANAALNCLQYYERIGWIGPTVFRQMTTYLRGLSMEELHNKKYDEPVHVEDPFEELRGSAFSPHIRSLQYIADIAGDDLEEHVMIARLADRRIERTREEGGDEDIPIVDGGFVPEDDSWEYPGDG